ncbi:hypothetical protein MKW14_15830, partial [Streptomyces sp. CME 23]
PGRRAVGRGARPGGARAAGGWGFAGSPAAGLSFGPAAGSSADVVRAVAGSGVCAWGVSG